MRRRCAPRWRACMRIMLVTFIRLLRWRQPWIGLVAMRSVSGFWVCCRERAWLNRRLRYDRLTRGTVMDGGAGKAGRSGDKAALSLPLAAFCKAGESTRDAFL